MKLDNSTIEILNNFAIINPSLKFEAGNVLKTVSPLKTIVAKASISDTVDGDFCIGELSRFLRSLTLCDDPEIELSEENFCTIKDSKNKIKYLYTSEELIKTPPKNDLSLPSVDVEFQLTNEIFSQVKKALSILSVNDLGVVGKDGVLSIVAFDASGATGDRYSLDIGETSKEFTVVFKSENLKLLPLDYTVRICSKGISEFENPTIKYWIVIDAANSVFNN